MILTSLNVTLEHVYQTRMFVMNLMTAMTSPMNKDAVRYNYTFVCFTISDILIVKLCYKFRFFSVVLYTVLRPR